jgi:hypothetical protein
VDAGAVIIATNGIESTTACIFTKAKGFNAPSGFPAAKTAVTIPANTTASMLLDQSFLTNAYLTMSMSGGDKAGISLTYANRRW